MDKKAVLQTGRLLLEPISEIDHDFILELVNTEGWLKYIGNRNIHSKSDAIAYIRKICDNQNMIYWTVRHKELKLPIGIITLIQREYLEYQDIGFAFLPLYSNRGFAYEATDTVLSTFIRLDTSPCIFAVTTPENVNSSKLLLKLGLQFDKELIIEDKTWVIYMASIKSLRSSVKWV